MPSLLEKAVNRLTTPIKRIVVRSMASRASARALLNAYYRGLNYESANVYHSRYAKIFRGSKSRLAAGDWKVSFMGTMIRLPLRPEYSWLDWDTAVSILGHDVEIKTTYANLIASEDRPEIFLDVGANYGTHSLLFSAVGIPAIAFEPNPQCSEYCKAASSLNNLQIQWESCAIGDRDGSARLVFPQDETWLGSVSQDVSEELVKKFGNVVTEGVPIRKLDDYADQLSGKRALLKIDVEGGEASVLRGASTILKRIKPLIIFETIDRKMRSDLYRFLDSRGYIVTALPWGKTNECLGLSQDAFCAKSDTNFLARYVENTDHPI